MINGEVMDRSAGAVETSHSSFTILQLLAAGGPEGGHFVPSHRPLMEKPGPNEAR